MNLDIQVASLFKTLREDRRRFRAERASRTYIYVCRALQSGTRVCFERRREAEKEEMRIAEMDRYLNPTSAI